MLAAALGTLLLFSVLAFATTLAWTLCILQTGIFALGAACSLKSKLRWNPVAFALSGVVACAALQLAARTTVYSFATVNALGTWTAYLVLFLAAAQILAETPVRRRFLQAALYAGFGIAMLSTVQYFTSQGEIYWMVHVRTGRAFGPFVNPDHYAAFVELILPLAIFEAQRDPRKVWLQAAIAGALYASVIASASRAGTILVTAELLALPWIAGRKRFAVKILGASVLCAAIATAVVGWETLLKRFEDSDPFRYRREIAVSTLEMIRQRPWSGVGLGNYANVYPQFASFDLGLVVDHAHDDWAEWTADGGLPMLLLMLSIAAMALRPAVRSVWGLGIYAVFLHALVDFPMHIPALAALVFTLLGAVTAGYGFRFRKSYT